MQLTRADGYDGLVAGDGQSSRGSGARQRTLAHLQALVTAAAVASVSTTTGCKKLLEQVKGGDSTDGGDADAGVAKDATTAEPAPTVPRVADPNATAESTLDATAFADAGEVQARVDAGAPKGPGHGYVVVDPVPPPARIPKDCNPPYTIDAKGVKHYKPKCL